MPTTHAIGRHQVVVDGDWVEMRFDGPIAGDESTGMQDVIAGVLASTGGRAYLLADISGLKGLGTDNRQQMADWHRKHRITAGVVFGGSFTVRVLVTLALKAIRLRNPDRFEAKFAADEAEARRWLAAERVKEVPRGR